MSDCKPFTDATRQAFREWAETSHSMQSEKDQAIAYLRYEQTIQDVEAQRDELVAACRALMGWIPGRGKTVYDYDERREEIWAEATAAIKGGDAVKIICAWCGKNLGEKPPYDDKSVTHGICKKCAKKMEEGKEKLTTCPYCGGPLEDTPIGAHCEACRWYFGDSPADADPGPVPTEWIEPSPEPGAFRIGSGWVTPWNGGRPR